MPICRLQKNHALSRQGGVLPPLFRLIHPQPLMTQTKQNKERFIHRRGARSLIPSSSSFSFPVPLLSTPFRFYLSLFSSFTSTGPRLFRAISFVLLARTSTRPYAFLRSLALDAGVPCPTYTLSLPLSVSLSHLPTPIVYSFSLSVARSLAHMRANEID